MDALATPDGGGGAKKLGAALIDLNRHSHLEARRARSREPKREPTMGFAQMDGDAVDALAGGEFEFSSRR